jgi:ClpA/ClpB-like protein
MAVPYDDQAQRVLRYADDEASWRQAPHVKLNHLLLGLMRETEAGAGRLLADLQLDLDQARERVGATRPTPAKPPGDLDSVLHWAQVEAEQLGHPAVRSEHLVLGLMAVPTGLGLALINCAAGFLPFGTDWAWGWAYEQRGVPVELRGPVPTAPWDRNFPYGNRRRDLDRVVPIGQTHTGGGLTVTLYSLESYPGGFVLRGRLHTETVLADREIPDRLHMSFPRLVFAAADDRGRDYIPTPDMSTIGSARSVGPDVESELPLTFLVPLAAEATRLAVEVVEIRWASSWRQVPLRDPTPIPPGQVRHETHSVTVTSQTLVQPLGWTFDIPLSGGGVHEVHREDPPPDAAPIGAPRHWVSEGSSATGTMVGIPGRRPPEGVGPGAQ